MQNLTFENIYRDAKKLKLTENDSYIGSYTAFLNYFEELPKIEHKHLVISSHFVYGWMPTIIQLDTKNSGEVLKYLNAVKSNHRLKEDEINKIKECINNSMVGTSKLLHFINPHNYAIWDSRIFRYVTGKKSQYGIANPKNYLNYLEKMESISNDKNYFKIHDIVQKHFKYSITPMRAIEIVMFETDRERQRKN
ncbi:hypothetical protein [Kordia zhangzhouensis]|uniref:hypothetical protein n=1 Tax=Kordia zhangzhouensis TaxID=1620405 RepID=UPI00062982FA|nr:hypothetical protein [Kordia zhangzhouensis]